MGKIFNVLKDNLDRAWYDSSNILYSECDDIEDSLKVVRITFKGGRTYEYKDVDVNDYVYFRESSSQGQTFNKMFSKKYKGGYITDLSESSIREELEKLINPTMESNNVEVSFNDNTVVINKNGNIEEVHFNCETPIFETLERIFNILGIKTSKTL